MRFASGVCGSATEPTGAISAARFWRRGAYQAVSNALVAARREGLIPWESVEDRLRRPRHVSMWDGLPDFAATAAAAYGCNVWARQLHRVECWLEKDTLSGIFEGCARWLWRHAERRARLRRLELDLRRRAATWGGDAVPYFGDFDPSGEDMVRSLGNRLASLGSQPEIIKCALTFEEVKRFELPPDFTKASDTRRAAFVARWGDIAVKAVWISPRCGGCSGVRLTNNATWQQRCADLPDRRGRPLGRRGGR
jgi:hypothetical protein